MRRGVLVVVAFVVMVVAGVMIVIAGGDWVVIGDAVEPGELGGGEGGERDEGEGDPTRDGRRGRTERDGGPLLQLRLRSH